MLIVLSMLSGCAIKSERMRVAYYIPADKEAPATNRCFDDCTERFGRDSEETLRCLDRCPGVDSERRACSRLPPNTYQDCVDGVTRRSVFRLSPLTVGFVIGSLAVGLALIWAER